MENNIDYDAILNELDLRAMRKKELAVIKANSEINAINRAREAYYEGAHDAIREIKNALTAAGKAKPKTPAKPA